MARNLSVFVLTLLLTVTSFTPAQSQDRNNMVRERMMADMRELKDQLTQLNKTVNQLQNTISDLRRENQRNKNRIIELEQRLEHLSKSSEDRTDRREDEPKTQTANKTRSTPNDRSAAKDDDEWVQAPNQSYEIRREPLDHKVIYVTTDDTTLTELAHKYYRDASFWRVIYELNRDKLPSPDVVPPGVNLVLPPVQNIE